MLKMNDEEQEEVSVCPIDYGEGVLVGNRILLSVIHRWGVVHRQKGTVVLVSRTSFVFPSD